jgi:transcriptional regulator with XRE-family HTH domain
MDAPGFANRLRSLREAKALSQEELARQLNMGRTTVAMYETGKREPDFETLRRLTDFFGVSTDYLLGRTDDRSSSLQEPRSLRGDKLGINDDKDDWPEGYRIIARDLSHLPADKRRKLAIELIKLAFPEEFQAEAPEKQVPKKPDK